MACTYLQVLWVLWLHKKSSDISVTAAVMSDNLASMFVTALLNNEMVSALKRVQDSFTSSTSSTVIQYVI